MRKRYPGQAYNPLTMLGAGLAIFGLAAILILFLLSAFAKGENPYLGIFTFLVFPSVMVVGLLLIPLGMWQERRRRERGRTTSLVFDLGNPHHRNVAVTFLIGTSVFLLVTTVGLYEGFHYTESVKFCGEVCHDVMAPERVGHRDSPHAKVACVRCHIGPGAGWYVQSKLSGARQVFKTILNTYPRPVPTPIRNLRPAQQVCEQCHWPQKFYAATQVTRDHFLGDEANTHWQIKLLVKIGGTSASPQGHPSGIHWHVDQAARMTYIASDAQRQAFDRVTWLKDGQEVVYTKGGAPLPDSLLAAARREGRERSLDCIDCHNRPSHIYKSPVTAANEAFVQGRLDAHAPFLKREVVKALSVGYATAEGARDSIRSALEGFYRARGETSPAGAVAATWALYDRNMFPQMRARWDVYPDNRGHLIFPGCFRCHGSDLATSDGRTISKDCNLCHLIVEQGPAGAGGDTLVTSGLEFRHPVDIGGAELETPCFECHKGDASLY